MNNKDSENHLKMPKILVKKNENIKQKKNLKGLKNNIKNFKTPENKTKKINFDSSIQIKKLKPQKESSLEREFNYLNNSISYYPKKAFQMFPVTI